ncbi:MAG: DEAD/DEAH box helicase [Anaerolineaceae bacterium]
MASESIIPFQFEQIKESPDFGENIPYWSESPASEAEFSPFLSNLDQNFVEILHQQGIHNLYSHQAKAINFIDQGANVVISTGTASGKSLCYQIPILNSQLKTFTSNALLLFPTKALANDQLNSLNYFCSHLQQINPNRQTSVPALYDGDTPNHLRSTIRKNASILLTNPDMLHLGILPHHTSWAEFFGKLKFIVIDEVHIYRGVFGSHVANVIRRLKRITDFYGASPQYILTSATISNPKEHASHLIDQPVQLVDHDGSPHGQKYFMIYNPPIIHEELGIRQGLITTAVQFSEFLVVQKSQTLMFSRSRRSVELIIHELRKLFPKKTEIIRGYRSGYLKSDRREIEQGLKSGTIKIAVATNALELGVDIGGVDVVIMAGYPGSIASTRQRAGRAGRKNNPSLAVLIASSNPLDQFLCRHPEYIMDRNPELAMLDPDNPLILIQHLQCSAFELPFDKKDRYGSLEPDILDSFLKIIESQGTLIDQAGRMIWSSQEYPANSVSLRSTNARSISLLLASGEESRIIGVLDYASSLWMAHTGAIYLHEGDTYLVESLDLEHNIANLKPTSLPYFTEPIKTQEINIIQDLDLETTPAYDIHFSEIEVNTQITGFKKIDWSSREVLAIEPLEMPVTTLRTFGFWIAINPAIVDRMRLENMWFSDPNDYGPHWEEIRNQVRKRDHYNCTLCGISEGDKPHHVHHKIPFRTFSNPVIANDLNNLITLCANCHRVVEINVKIRSAISGLNYALYHLAPLLVMCDENDLGSYADASANFADKQSVILIYDSIPAGIGLSQSLFRLHRSLLLNAKELIGSCECEDGCPSCVGPISETGIGGKRETRYLISLLLNRAQE